MKYKNISLRFSKNTMHMHITPWIKLQNFKKRKLHIAHRRMPNSIYSCILSHVHWKSPEKACLKVVKTEIQSRLSNESFNSIMRILMQGLLITEFKENNSKSWHLNQQKRKKFEDRKVTKKQQPNFKISNLQSHYTTTNGSSDKEDWLFVFGTSILVYSSVVLYNTMFFFFITW